jgi:hypothetical protein
LFFSIKKGILKLMKKISILATLIWLSLSALEAQVIHDPNDKIYKDIDTWATQGYITQVLPLIRPYPAQLIDSYLDEVIEKGAPSEQEKAATYKAAIGPNARLVHVGATALVQGQNGDASVEASPFADGVLRLKDWLSASYSVYAWFTTRTPGNELNIPGSWSAYPDLIKDWVNVGPFYIMQDWTSTLAAGNKDFYFQAGLNRTSVGPFYDNGVIVGPQAGRAGHFSLEYLSDAWSFEMMLLSLNATDDFGEGIFPEKYFVFHTFNFRPVKNLELGFQESVMWGGRMELLYLVPFTWLFSAQSMSDFGDNSFIGLHARYFAPHNIQALAQIYVDDFHFNDFVRFKFNTKYKLAGELGLKWAPPESRLSSLSADYTIVFPYMYSHWRSLDDTQRYLQPGDNDYGANYGTYSHLGRSLGTDLPPDSHRISIRASRQMIRNLDLSASMYFTQHGNPSIGVEDMKPENHDGSIFDDGNTDPAPPDKSVNNYNTIKFLTQPTVDTRLAFGLGVTWSLPFFSRGTFGINAEYVLEYGWNRGLVSGNDGVTNYWSIGASWRF